MACFLDFYWYYNEACMYVQGNCIWHTRMCVEDTFLQICSYTYYTKIFTLEDIATEPMLLSNETNTEPVSSNSAVAKQCRIVNSSDETFTKLSPMQTY